MKSIVEKAKGKVNDLNTVFNKSVNDLEKHLSDFLKKDDANEKTEA